MLKLKYLLLTLFFSISLIANSNIELTNIETKSIEIQQKVFGEHLFTGNFSKLSQNIYNPNYTINLGDNINLKMWGAFEYEAMLTVDSQGNIFIPKVGTIKVIGIKNSELVNIISNKTKQVYKNNVFIYADLATYQNVSVFVTGNVYKPGLYQGLGSDSIIQFIDKAGGINKEYGSFRKISILRNNQIIENIDLYDFLLKGQLNLGTFKNGDVVLIDSIGTYINVEGEVQRPFRIESKSNTITLFELGDIVGLKPTTTHAMVKTYINNDIKNASYTLNEFKNIYLKSGDTVEFLPDYSSNDIKITVEGEHNDLHSFVLKKGSTLKDLKTNFKFNDYSNIESIQLFRKSVAKTQKKLIEAQLKELEAIALTTTSSTQQEATTRSLETKAILEFIERAKKIEPKGQIVINEKTNENNIILEDGDTIFVPNKNNIVIVQGEVTLPGAFTYQENQSLSDYIALAGDINERANKERILIIHASGKAEKADISSFSFSSVDIKKGDSILVLPKVDSKNLEITSKITQILYHIAVATKVVLDI